jgi:Biotin-lipoyl like
MPGMHVLPPRYRSHDLIRRRRRGSDAEVDLRMRNSLIVGAGPSLCGRYCRGFARACEKPGRCGGEKSAASARRSSHSRRHRRSQRCGYHPAGLGSRAGFRHRSLTSRLKGTITKINFKEGQQVHTGDVLFELNARPFQLDQAKAMLARVRTRICSAIASC